MNVSEIVEEETLLFQGNFGLEKESLRVDEKGFLAHTPHPFLGNKNIDRDFCENQIEIITDVCGSVDEVYAQLERLHKLAVITLYKQEHREYIWQFSNPPYVQGEEDIPVAVFDGKLKGKEIYREYLAGKYGKRKMLYSGIHFNFSLKDEYIHKLSGDRKEKNIKDFKNNIYLKLAKLVTKYSWFLVYLTAASPVMDKSFLTDGCQGQDYISGYASPRCGEKGYWNNFVPILDYNDIESYVNSIQSYVDAGQLKSSAELYYPVRIKPLGENSLENLKSGGVNHIELRMLDLNPMSEIGIMKEDLQFIHCFLVYLLSLEDIDFNASEQTEAIKNAKNAALLNDENIVIETGWNENRNIKKEALTILEDMADFYKGKNLLYGESSILFQKNKLEKEGMRYAEIIRQEFSKEYVIKGLKLAEKYAKNF